MSAETQKVVYMPKDAVSHAEEGGSGLFQTSAVRTEECDEAMIRYATVAEVIETATRVVNMGMTDLALYADARSDLRAALARVGGAA